MLGWLYREGLGGQQDYVLAYKWYTLAEAHGDPGAVVIRDAMAAWMTADQIAEAQELVREWWNTNND